MRVKYSPNSSFSTKLNEHNYVIQTSFEQTCETLLRCTLYEPNPINFWSVFQRRNVFQNMPQISQNHLLFPFDKLSSGSSKKHLCKS